MRNVLMASFYALVSFVACGDAVPPTFNQVDAGDTYAPVDTFTPADTIVPADTAAPADTFTPVDTTTPSDIYVVKIDCGTHLVQPVVYFFDVEVSEWSAWYPHGTQANDFETNYEVTFLTSEIKNTITTFDQAHNPIGSVVGFDLGFRATGLPGWPWFGETGAPALGECDVFVNGVKPGTNLSFPEWSGVPLLQVHL